VTVDTHVKHRKRKDLKMDDRNAFQAVAVFSLDQNMFLDEIERHLVWNQKRIPSAYISVFNGIGTYHAQAPASDIHRLTHFKVMQTDGQISITRGVSASDSV